MVGLWEGRDPQLKDQIIIFTAHYDHLGMIEGEGDQIYNGAWDNALGTSGIVEIARAFAKAGTRPRRSVAFMACAAEEKGLLGSQWFAARPPVPLRRFVANINIDMPQVFGLTRDMAAIGHDANTLGRVLREVAAETRIPGEDRTLEIKGDRNPNAGSFYRSDQVNFAKAGVPALYGLPGGDYISPLGFDPEAYRKTHYHQPSDEINEQWNLSGCVRDMRVLFKVAARVADHDEQPRWNAGNEFENAWKELYGR